MPRLILKANDLPCLAAAFVRLESDGAITLLSGASICSADGNYRLDRNVRYAGGGDMLPQLKVNDVDVVEPRGTRVAGATRNVILRSKSGIGVLLLYFREQACWQMECRSPISVAMSALIPRKP